MSKQQEHNVAHPVLQVLKALQAVTIDNQELLALLDSFVSLSVLRHLNISNNLFTALPERFDQLAELSEHPFSASNLARA